MPESTISPEEAQRLYKQWLSDVQAFLVEKDDGTLSALTLATRSKEYALALAVGRERERLTKEVEWWRGEAGRVAVELHATRQRLDEFRRAAKAQAQAALKTLEAALGSEQGMPEMAYQIEQAKLTSYGDILDLLGEGDQGVIDITVKKSEPSPIETLAAALASLQREVLPANSERYKLMAEPVLAEIVAICQGHMEAKAAEGQGTVEKERDEALREIARLRRVARFNRQGFLDQFFGLKGDYDQLKSAASGLLTAIEKVADYDPETRVGRAMAALETAMGIPVVLADTIPEGQIQMTDGTQTVAALISSTVPPPWTFLYDRRPEDGQKVIVWCQDDPTADPWIESGKYLAVEEEFEFSHSVLPTGLRGVLIFWRPDDIEPPTPEQIAAAKEGNEGRSNDPLVHR